MANISREDDEKDFEERKRNNLTRPGDRIAQQPDNERAFVDPVRIALQSLKLK